MYDCIIIGAGFSGSVIARILAEKEKKVLILERRNCIGGNAYDYQDKSTGILIQKYGPHIFHTSRKNVYDFVNKYDVWSDFKLKCQVYMEGQFTPSPFNLKTIDIYYESEKSMIIKQAIKNEYGSKKKSTIVEMLNSSNHVIREYAQFLYEKDYSLYTAKQWGIPPSQVDKNVLKRVPIRFDYGEYYFDDTYECLPQKGFTHFFERLLSHKNIDIKLNINALDLLDLKENKACINQRLYKQPIVYTGAIDELFRYKYGNLPYRSLRFEYKTIDKESFQNVPVVAYPETPDFTRITEYKKLTAKKISTPNTIIAYEYPLIFDQDHTDKVDPYYPINNGKTDKIYNLYLKEAEKIKNLFLCGRLANYKYYNMDDVIDNAIQMAEKILDYMVVSH